LFLPVLRLLAGQVPSWLGCRAPQDYVDHGSWCVGVSITKPHFLISISLKGVWGVFIGGVSELHHWFEVVTHQTLAGQARKWADRPHFGSLMPGLCATSSHHAILSMTMSYFRHNEDMHGFWSIWCFSIIQCSWNGKSTKLVELVSNKHLSSISWLKSRYVGGRYVYFMTANIPHTEFFLSLSKRKELNPGDITRTLVP
jgi:hypothetical protein